MFQRMHCKLYGNEPNSTKPKHTENKTPQRKVRVIIRPEMVSILKTHYPSQVVMEKRNPGMQLSSWKITQMELAECRVKKGSQKPKKTAVTKHGYLTDI